MATQHIPVEFPNEVFVTKNPGEYELRYGAHIIDLMRYESGVKQLAVYKLDRLIHAKLCVEEETP